jgi:hypothetical protein
MCVGVDLRRPGDPEGLEKMEATFCTGLRDSRLATMYVGPPCSLASLAYRDPEGRQLTVGPGMGTPDQRICSTVATKTAGSSVQIALVVCRTDECAVRGLEKIRGCELWWELAAVVLSAAHLVNLVLS